jgi:ABC-type Fe3+/spermidine/putrescine transport system ATPase subunit
VTPSERRSPPTTGRLQLDGLSKRYGAQLAVDAVSLTLEPDETLALLGPSGCGKSTLLRLIAGLERPDVGRLTLGGRDLVRVPPQRRTFGMVFQDYALFPHLSVADNVAYGLVERGWRRAERRARVDELLALVGLVGYRARRSFELSGGEQQRVALARALAPRPALLLLDEPLSNLDLALRDALKGELKALLAGLDISAVYVTHDQSEAFTLADTVAVMRAGRLQQSAPAAVLYAQPATAWVARFLGHRNLFLSAQLGPLAAPDAPLTLVRSDLVRLGRGALEARVLSATRSGALIDLQLGLEHPRVGLHWQGFERDLPAGDDLRVGSRVRLELPPGAVVGVAEDDGALSHIDKAHEPQAAETSR